MDNCRRDCRQERESISRIKGSQEPVGYWEKSAKDEDEERAYKCGMAVDFLCQFPSVTESIEQDKRGAGMWCVLC